MRKKLTKTRTRRLLKPVGSANWLLFKHMADNHGLTLLESELDEICRVVMQMRMPRALTAKDLDGFTKSQWKDIMESYKPNARDEARRAKGVQHGIERSSRRRL